MFIFSEPWILNDVQHFNILFSHVNNVGFFHNIPNDMQFIGLKNYTVLIVLLLKIDSVTALINAPNLKPNYLYYNSQNMPISFTSVLEPLQKINNITVDFGSSIFLKRIDITYESEVLFHFKFSAS